MRRVPCCPVRTQPSPARRLRSGSTPRPDVPQQPPVKGQSRLADHGPEVPDEACHFHSLFPDFELFLLPEAWHFPQLDESEEAARLIYSQRSSQVLIHV